MLVPSNVSTYLEDGWELSAEPHTKAGLQALISALSGEDDEGGSLLDNYDEGKERDAVEELLHRMTKGMSSGWYEQETHVLRDFEMLMSILSCFARPGWRVAMTLLDDGSLGYAHRPMSTDEVITHLLINEGPTSTLQQIVDFLDLHEDTEQFRHFFFGPDSVRTEK